MKEPSIATVYACLYPGLAEVAREHGYALALHGSMRRDLDLVAIPWTEHAVEPQVVVEAIMQHASARLFPDVLRRHGHLTDEQIQQICAQHKESDPAVKPHGRLAWSLHLDFGCYIDLSVMPKMQPQS